MKEKMKFKLSELKVQSFVTRLKKEQEERVLGGGSETGRYGLCCNIHSAAYPPDCEELSYTGYCEEPQ